MPQFIRAFVAVEAPPETQSAVAGLIARLRSARFSESPAKVTWVKPGQMHWTLKFLGDVSLLDAPSICAAVARGAAGMQSFDVEPRGVGAFPDLKRPRTIWLGMGDGSESMTALQASIEARLAEIGYRPEARRFRPHLTLGRVRGQSGLAELSERIATESDFAAGLTTVFDVTVLSSDLTREGPVYEPLGHVELGP